MLHRLFGLLGTDLAIDLGTANTLVSVAGEGLVVNEPSIVAVEEGTSRILSGGCAVGHLARQMQGRTPQSISVVRPLGEGVIRDFELCEAMLRYFIRKAQPPGSLRPAARAGGGARLHHAGRKTGRLQQHPAGRRPRSAGHCRGQGRGHRSRAADRRARGQHGLRHRRRHDRSGRVEPGRGRGPASRCAWRATPWTGPSSTTCGVTTACASVSWPPSNCGSTSAAPRRWPTSYRTRCAASTPSAACRARRPITSEEVRDALAGPLEQIVEAIKHTLDDCNTDLVADLVDGGLVLAGGGALLRGLDRYLSRADRTADARLRRAAHGRRPRHPDLPGTLPSLAPQPCNRATRTCNRVGFVPPAAPRSELLAV